MAVGPTRKPRATVNETLRDRGIAHAVFLERHKAQVVREILRVLDDEVIPDLIERITARMARIEARGFDIDPAGTKRLSELLEVMQETVDAWATGYAAEMAERMPEIGAAEVKWQNDLIHAILPVTWDTVIPATGILTSAIMESPIDGQLLESIVERMSAGTKANVEKAIRIGIAEGESIDRITTRVRKATDLTRSSAEAVARTAVGHASNMGRAAYYQENEDLIKAVQWVATLDTRTCPSCQALDGKTFPISKGARPPRHINCRCTTVPVLRSMQELGLPAKDFDPGTRASMNGQVSAKLTFGEWLKTQPPSIQDEALGPNRARLWRTGELDIDDFVDPRGEAYTLDELRKREKAAWAKAGL